MYFQEGNKEYRKGELTNAIYFYTEGINVSCEDDELNAKLYSNRAAAHFSLGEFICAKLKLYTSGEIYRHLQIEGKPL